MLSTAEAVKEADVIMVLLPDTEQAAMYSEDIEPNLDERNSLAFAHGFNIHFGAGRAAEGRRRVDDRAEGAGPPRAAHVRRGRRRARARRGVGRRDRQGRSRSRSRTPRAIGATRAGVLDTTFEEETETDLFGEQVVLCGGLTELIKASYETLVDAGYQPELAYFETLHEVKLIVDLIYEGGIANMRYSISDTAEYGDMTRGPRIITDDTAGRDEADPRRDPVRQVRRTSGSSRTRPGGRRSTRCAAAPRSTRSKRSASGCGR